MKVNLKNYNNNGYIPGNKLKIIFWYYINILFIKSYFFPWSRLKIFFLKLFGAKIGKRVIIKPGVNVKYPWKLEIGDDCWIGENVWIDNLDFVKISKNVCISQGSLLICGNHNYKKSSFDLVLGPITIEEGVWICAKSVVCQNTILHSHSILLSGSVLTSDMQKFCIYRGNPATKIKNREIN